MVMMTVDIHVHTQAYENYGSRWKAKGGETFVIPNFTLPQDNLQAAGNAAVDAVRNLIEVNNDMTEVSIIDWEYAPTGSLTPWERDQKEFDGRIDSPSPRIAA